MGDFNLLPRNGKVAGAHSSMFWMQCSVIPHCCVSNFSYSIAIRWSWKSCWDQTRVQPTETNTAQHNLQILLVVGYPTTNKCLVGIGYPTTNIHHFISWCCVPNTNNCWVVLCTQLFSKKDPAWEKNHSCLKGSSLVQKTSLLWLFLIFGDKFNK